MEEYSNLKEGFLELDGVEYYAKYVTDELNQLLGNELAKYCGINSVLDKVVKSDDEYFYLSYSLHNLGVYESAYSDGIESLNLYDIWEVLEEDYPNDVEKLMRQLIRIFVFDSIMIYGDRHLENFGILRMNKNIDFYILDNEYLFCNASVGRLNPYLRENLDKECGDEDDRFRNHEIMEENYKRFDTLINSTSSEFYEDIKDIYYKLEPSVVREKMLELKEHYPGLIEDYTIVNRMLMYEENYKKITEILMKRGVINGKRIH